MSEATWKVILTRRFRERLLDIESFLEAAGAGTAFDRLIDDVESVVIPNLTRFPRIGRPYARRSFLSIETKAMLGGLSASQAEELREYLHGDYLILYASHEPARAVYLISIRHHRQLSFDFEGLRPGA